MCLCKVDAALVHDRNSSNHFFGKEVQMQDQCNKLVLYSSFGHDVFSPW